MVCLTPVKPSINNSEFITGPFKMTETVTCNNNPLQATGFRLILDRTNYPNVAFFANTVNHPNMELDAATQHSRRVAIPQSGDTLTFGELNVTMLIDEDMRAYTEIYNWMIRLVNENREGKTGDGIPTESDIILQILTSHNNLGKEIRYHDCVPTSLGQIPFAASTAEVEPIFVDVTFRFSYFELV